MKLSKKNKVIFAFGVIVVGAVIIQTLWYQTMLVSLLLITLAFVKHKVHPIKKELLWYVISGATGALGESFIMTNGAWSYQAEHLINFPLWLPIAWALTGTTAITLYEGLTEAK